MGLEPGCSLADEEDEYTLIGWARPNGAGEIVFRQAGHPANDERANAEEPWAGMWRAVYIKVDG